MSSTIFGTYYFNKLFLVYLKLKHKRVSYFDLETLWSLPTALRSHTGRGTSLPLPEASGVTQRPLCLEGEGGKRRVALSMDQASPAPGPGVSEGLAIHAGLKGSGL